MYTSRRRSVLKQDMLLETNGPLQKNNLRVLGQEEDEKFIKFAEENLEEKVQSSEVEIIHTIDRARKSDRDQGLRRESS